ncbi:MAG: permease-like cell division protein FtsX [Candidatus Xenobiia bacterium LiM19]
MIHNISYFIREVYINLRRNVLMSMASISTVLILSLILGFFIIIVVNLNYWSENIVKQLQIVVYLSDGMNDRQIGILKSSLETTPHIDKIRFISKEEALKNMKERLKNQFEISDIGKNPLPNSFEVIVTEPDKIPKVAAIIKTYPGVDKVRYGEKIAGKLLVINRAVHWIGIIIVLALFLSTLFIVSNTIRLTVFARRREIAVMQLVGAANWFIRWPFIMEGVLQGFLGALISILLIKLIYAYFMPKIETALPFLTMVPFNSLFSTVSLILLGTGIFVGSVGSLISVNRFLKFRQIHF